MCDKISRVVAFNTMREVDQTAKKMNSKRKTKKEGRNYVQQN